MFLREINRFNDSRFCSNVDHECSSLNSVPYLDFTYFIFKKANLINSIFCYFLVVERSLPFYRLYIFKYTKRIYFHNLN